MAKRIVITGASRGIGLALVKHLSAGNHQIFACCRHPDEAHDLQGYAASVSNVIVVGLDVMSAQSLKLAEQAVDGPIDLLVCNAGVLNGYGGLGAQENALEQSAMDVFSDVLRTNITGVFFTVQAFLSKVRSGTSPSIAIVSSHMGSQQHEAANAYAYRASKAGANNIMVTLKHELAGEQIAVAAYHPGWVRTDMGGASAHLSVEQSAAALAQRFEELDMSLSGGFINYDGASLDL